MQDKTFFHNTEEESSPYSIERSFLKDIDLVFFMKEVLEGLLKTFFFAKNQNLHGMKTIPTVLKYLMFSDLKLQPNQKVFSAFECPILLGLHPID